MAVNTDGNHYIKLKLYYILLHTPILELSKVKFCSLISIMHHILSLKVKQEFTRRIKEGCVVLLSLRNPISFLVHPPKEKQGKGRDTTIEIGLLLTPPCWCSWKLTRHGMNPILYRCQRNLWMHGMKLWEMTVMLQ